MALFNFKNYREYLQFQVGEKGTRHGKRKALAEFIPVHSTFISQVLSGQSNLSLEQAEQVNLFFKHTEVEADYFFLLVNLERAGSVALKKRFQHKINEIHQERLKIKNRIKKSNTISKEDQQEFYSTYVYSAIHVLSSIPDYQTPEAMAEFLHIPIQKCKQCIQFLMKIGLVAESGHKFSTGVQNIHLPEDSQLIIQHHSNWRLVALQHLQKFDKKDFHYSACVSLSKSDIGKVKEILFQSLQQNIEIIGKSKEETACVLNLDFFELQ